MRHPLWTMFPDYTASNPYQALLATALDASWDVRFGPIGQALDDTLQGAHSVFHLHWEDAIYRAAASEPEANAMAVTFLAECEAFRASRGRLVWTMHNAAPHENRFPATDAALRRELAAMADCIHVHNEAGAKLALSYGAPPAHILHQPHPQLYTAYPDDIDDSAARRYLDLCPKQTVFVCFGAMRAYKGIDALFDAFVALHHERQDVALVVAGQHGQAAPARLARPHPGIRLLPRFIPDAEVQYVLRAADFVVLPYTSILTSGSMMLALGFGRPVLAPDHPGLVEVLQDNEAGLIYKPGELLPALRRARAMPAEQRIALAHAARAIGQRPVSLLADALRSRCQNQESLVLS
jgi:beta-1,4-mannosyltransferase